MLLVLAQNLPTPEQALAAVTSKSGKGIYASADILFNGSVFGRDSLVVAEDLLEIKPELVELILTVLAGFQGTKFNNINEEEPGKIIHQYATNLIDGQPRSPASQTIYDEISSKWGGDKDELAYYGSVDSTPLFVRVLCRYCHLHGSAILEKKLLNREHVKVSMSDVLNRAITWVISKLESSPVGLLGYKALNPFGIQNQSWKDSVEFYVHNNGQRVNHEKEVYSIEVQGVTYDALVLASEHMPEMSLELNGLAKNIQDRTLKLLWMPDENYFALGLDFDGEGNIRVIKTIAANAAALLDSNIFDDVSDVERAPYITGIIRQIFSEDFLTNAGIRSRGLHHSNLLPFWDYHGSFVTWPKETFAIARGLRQQGFELLADQLENRIINVANRGASYLEFIYVDGDGRVLLGPEAPDSTNDAITVLSTNRPEHMQAWTISAVMSIAQRRVQPSLHLRPKSDSWKEELENEIINFTPMLDIISDPNKLEEIYPFYKYRIEKHNPATADYFLDKLHENIRTNNET